VNHFFTLAPLMLLFSACVSTTTPHISSHEPDHSFSSIIQRCDSIDIEQTQAIKQSDDIGLNPNSISLLNWNTYKGGKKNWAEDFHQLSQHKDIITLQEARLNKALHSTLDSLKLYWELTTAFLYNEDEVGVLTASNVSPSKLCSIHSHEPVIKLPKTLMVSKYPILGHDKELLVANIHSINFTLGIDKYAEQINVLQDVIKQHQGPVIVAGDFNSWSSSRVEIIKQFEQVLSLKSLQYQNHNRTTVFGYAIDHVFYRGLTPSSIETPKVDSSDHNPIMVNFSVNHLQKEVTLAND